MGWLWREGLVQASRRYALQRRILQTAPVRTSRSGTAEVRVLTWSRDYIDQIWALKSFYHHAEVEYPLYIHDGGLSQAEAGTLLDHFPDAVFVSARSAESRIALELQRRSLRRCLAYRQRSVLARRIFDFYCLSGADRIITVDADVLFFRRPTELLEDGKQRSNLYNRDGGYWYSMSVDEIESAFGLSPVRYVNAGLSSVWRESMDPKLIEGWLAQPRLFDELWLTEQTVHAMCSAIFGGRLLPDSYQIGPLLGLRKDVVSKHYPGFFRRSHYEEGMARLVKQGFLRGLGTGRGT